jgi:hypothetical protein
MPSGATPAPPIRSTEAAPPGSRPWPVAAGVPRALRRFAPEALRYYDPAKRQTGPRAALKLQQMMTFHAETQHQTVTATDDTTIGHPCPRPGPARLGTPNQPRS